MEQSFNLSYDDITCMWHNIPYNGMNMLGAFENILHSAPFGAARSQSSQSLMCLCEACNFDTRNSAKHLKTSAIINASIGGLGFGDIKALFKQGWFRWHPHIYLFLVSY